MMKGVRETFSPYDSADYLKTEADIAAYLEACADEAPNDPAFMLKALSTVARARNMSQLAEAARHDAGQVAQGVVRGRQPEPRQHHEGGKAAWLSAGVGAGSGVSGCVANNE